MILNTLIAFIVLLSTTPTTTSFSPSPILRTPSLFTPPSHTKLTATITTTTKQQPTPIDPTQLTPPPLPTSTKKTKKNALTPSPPPTIPTGKALVLQTVLSQITKNYGPGTIHLLGSAPHLKVDTISTGSLTLDLALGGGLPKGRVIEIYGPESSGKTTLALHAIAECQKKGGIAAFVDAEHALDPKYAERLGVDVKNLFVSQPDSGEMALDIVDQLVRSSAVDIIVIDSVAALVPRAELEGQMGDTTIGLQARLMSKAMRKITGSLSKSQTTVIFLNQLRSKIGVLYGSPEVTSGGNALKFYASVRLDTRRKEILPDNRGIQVKVKVVKNKVAPPFKLCFIDILFGSGIDSIGCLVEAATECGVIVRKGSWYSYENVNVGQGKEKTCAYIKDNEGVREEIEGKVRKFISSGSGEMGEEGVGVEEEETEMQSGLEIFDGEEVEAEVEADEVNE